VVLQSDLRRSIQQSADRLRSLVRRMQRFTNLDQADVQKIDLNELLSDVAALIEPQLPKNAKLELDLEPVNPFVCRPQQLSAVFSNLVSNAMDALDGQGKIRISTRQRAGEVEVQIADDGRGVDPREIGKLFDPGFKVAGGRVGTGNWSMFNSRQIVRGHGGDIHITSKPGEGTTVRVTFQTSEQQVS
jgi:two-component system, NtrC family, sensor kinase